MRFLLDPDPNGQGGGGNPAPTPAPAQAPPAQPPAAAQPQTVTITLEQLQQFQGGLSQLAQMAEANRKAEADKLQAIADRQAKEGQWEKALETLRGQHTTELETERQARIKVETVAKTAWRDRELTEAIAAVPNLNPVRLLRARPGPPLTRNPSDPFPIPRRAASTPGRTDSWLSTTRASRPPTTR
jgi:hypothetical protein